MEVSKIYRDFQKEKNALLKQTTQNLPNSIKSQIQILINEYEGILSYLNSHDKNSILIQASDTLSHLVQILLRFDHSV
jgi:hypothetical protein